MTSHLVRQAVHSALFIAAFSVTTAAISSPVRAQSQPDAESGNVEVTITGSRIRRIEQEGPSPVVTITAEELDNRGYNTVLEALNDLPQNSGGGIDQQFAFGFTPSASAIDLRGFGFGRALVLIDGRRVPVFPLAASGTDNFVDLSSIPIAAIERIEVLTDSASAIYGSDAISGVINIILKDTTEAQIMLRHGDTTEGGGSQTRLQIADGIETSNGATALFFVEYFQQDKIRFTDREYSRSDRLGGVNGPGPGTFSGIGTPGTFVSANPSIPSLPAANCDTSNGGPGVEDGLCRFNRAFYRLLMPDMEHVSATAKLSLPLTESVRAFGRATYFKGNVESQIEPVGADTTIVPANNPNNPAGFAGAWQRRMVEFGPRIQDIDNDTYSLVAGLQGTLDSGYSWEFGAHYSEQRIRQIGSGYLRSAALDQAVTTGIVDLDGDGVNDPINLFNPIPQAVVDALSVTPRTDGLSTIGSLDFQLSGTLLETPWGPAQFAFVTEFTKQRFEDKRDADTLAGNIEGLGGSSGGGDRKYAAAGVEVEIPLFSRLTVNLAGRYDNYDDDSNVGGAFSPRVAVQFRPADSVMLRASAGRSFRAPDLQRLFGAETGGFASLIDTPQCIADGGTGRGDPNVASCNTLIQSVNIRAGANRNLEEERGKNASFGFVWQPLGGLSTTVDFWYVKLEDIVNTPNAQFILDQNALTGAFADAIQRSTVATGCVPQLNAGCLDTVSAQARNLAFQRARGVDTTVQYSINAGSLGAFIFKASASYLDRLEIQQKPGDPVFDVLRQGRVGEFVRFKGNANVSWARGKWGGSLFVNHIGSFTPDQTAIVNKVDSYTTLNVSASYALPWNSYIQAGVNNLFNEDPPLDLSDGNAGQPFYNQFFHDPFGSTWWLSYVQKF